MLYQDTLTGMLHEVPDSQVNGWGFGEDPYGVGEPQMVYDGLGNPLGWGFLKKLVKKALPLAKFIPGPYGQLINRALPMVQRSLKLNGLGELAPVAVAPVAVARPPVPMAAPMRMRRPLPPGWIRPQGPQTGAPPRRLYLRCAAWPGPRGLVPPVTAQSPGVPGAVAVPMPVAVRGAGRARGRGRRR